VKLLIYDKKLSFKCINGGCSGMPEHTEANPPTLHYDKPTNINIK